MPVEVIPQTIRAVQEVAQITYEPFSSASEYKEEFIQESVQLVISKLGANLVQHVSEARSSTTPCVLSAKLEQLRGSDRFRQKKARRGRRPRCHHGRRKDDASHKCSSDGTSQI